MVNTTKTTIVPRAVALAAAACCLGACTIAAAQQPNVHYLHHGNLPPGAIGSVRLQRGGPVVGFFQPVEVRAPAGVTIAVAEGGGFTEPQAAPVRVGLLIGQVYRLRVMGIPLQAGLELFPTIEVVDRIYVPQGQDARFPIVIDLHPDDLKLALDGKFVTRVIYLEDPQSAIPNLQDPKEQPWFEVGPGHDPLAVADQLGRPVAILRIGGRVPSGAVEADQAFLYGCPPLVKYPPEMNVLPPAPPGEPFPEPAPQQPAAALMRSQR